MGRGWARAVLGLGCAVAVALAVPQTAVAADAEFEALVQCRTILADHDWAQRIWPETNAELKPARSQALPDSEIRHQVHDLLRKESALQDLYGVVLDARALQTEMNRIAINTRAPDRLREQYQLLGNNAEGVANCLARPLLIERRLREGFAFDARWHGELRQRAEGALAAGATADALAASAGREQTLTLVLDDDKATRDLTAEDDGLLRLSAEEFARERARLLPAEPDLPGATLARQHGGLRETAEAFVEETVLSQSEDRLVVRSRVWAKQSFEAWWSSRRAGYVPASGWKSSDALRLPEIQGRAVAAATAAMDTWKNFDIPSERYLHTAVWTGSEMIVWGGIGASNNRLNTGGRYNPATDSWTATSTTGAPSGRYDHTAVWTGSEMIVWGGLDASNNRLNTGGRYNPATDSWTATSTTGAPSARYDHTAVWSGSEMMVFGGCCTIAELGIYYPYDTAQPTTAVITSDLPDPSMVGAAVPVDVSVTGTTTQPSAGTVTITASTGETCSDTSPSAGSGSAALYSCSITFNSTGPRDLTAEYGGSVDHQPSTSTAEPHAVITALTVDPTTLANGTFGVPYSAMLSASGPGSSAPYSFAVTAGMLPPGLMLAGDGNLTGSPSAAGGPFNFTVTATDSSGAGVGGPFTGTRNYSISIAMANQAALAAIATPSTIPFMGTSTLSTTGGSGTGAVSYAVTAGGAFCSVVGNTLTGIGVGTCTVTATKAADANYNAATATVDVEVTPANQAALTATATPSTIAFNGMSTLGTTGGSGTGAVSYAVTAGGAFCSVVGNTLTGIGVGTCTVTATKAADANYNAAMATVDVEVLPAADLEISLSDGTPYAIPGGFVEYEILVGNAGPLGVSGARVEVAEPTGLSSALWTCTPVQGASCPTAGGSGAIDELIDLPVNGVLRYVFSATVDAALGATITLSAGVTGPLGTVEIDGSDNSATDVNSVVADGLFANGFENATPRLSVSIKER